MYLESAVCDYLREEIFPQIVAGPYGDIELTRLGYRRPVYLFIEKTRNIMVVGKCFHCSGISLEAAWQEAEKEYTYLELLRNSFGMDREPDKVVAPLGENKELSALLVMEKAPGQTLDYYIEKAIVEQQGQELIKKLTNLSRFFARLHQTFNTESTVPSDLPRLYLKRLLNSLAEEPLSVEDRCSIEKQAELWWTEEGIFNEDREVIVHGDATPTNFHFDKENVIAIDFEKMMLADRCWDLGFIAAELKHYFMWRKHDGWAAEPFIQHFLREYAAHDNDTKFFYNITRKLPLYMALGLLRIARHSWLGEEHRQSLITEARNCLKYGL